MSRSGARSPRIVVGLDGSRAAMQAVRWAVDEAVDREIPLLLLYAIDETGDVHSDTAADIATAETRVRSAISMIEALKKPVKTEAEIVRRHPVTALLAASRWAAMVCVGAIGFDNAAHGRIGSTGSTLASGAHSPVAVVPRTTPGPDGRGLVLAVVDGSSAGDSVLELGIAEARLRAGPLRVFTVRRPRRSGPDNTVATVDRRAVAKVERRVDYWRNMRPNLDIELVSDHNGLLNYLEHLQRNATPIQLIVVDPRRPGPLDILLGAAARAPLQAAGCTVLTCGRTWWL